MYIFVYLFIYLFIYSLIHSFPDLLIHLFTYLFTCFIFIFVKESYRAVCDLTSLIVLGTIHEIKLKLCLISSNIAPINIFVKLVNMLQNCLAKKTILFLENLCWTKFWACNIKFSAKYFFVCEKVFITAFKIELLFRHCASQARVSE